MKRVFHSLTVLAFLTPILIQVSPVVAADRAAQKTPATVCLKPEDIRSTQVKDTRTILYQMRDGKVWRNVLKGPCPGLNLGGAYSQEIHNDTICANAQEITVVATGEVCTLGEFTRAN